MNVESTKNYKKADSIQKTQSISKPQKKDDTKFAEELKSLKKESEKDNAQEVSKEEASSNANKETESSKDKESLQSNVNDCQTETEQLADEQDQTKKLQEETANAVTEKNKNTEGHSGENPKDARMFDGEELFSKNGNMKEAIKDELPIQNFSNETENTDKLNVKESSDNIEGAIDGLKDVFDEFSKLNKSKDKPVCNPIDSKEKENNEDVELIDNNMNIQEPHDKINLQMGSNMNFSGDGQPFSDFVAPEKTKPSLAVNAKDLEEEKSILSTMDENIAIANKNIAMSKNKTVETEEGIKKVDRKTNVTVETIVSYDKVVMDKADVDFFVNLVENGEVDMNSVQNVSKSSAVSKTLADLIAKSMQDNKPIRIDFDNDISVIIKVSRDGKISADFLPSSQVAEAYLKENLPLLRQRFDDNNIEYEELNQRKQKQNDQENRKKGRKDE